MSSHTVITAAILFSAIALYALGMWQGALILMVAGAGLELWFWLRVWRGGKNTDSGETPRQSSS